MPSTRVSWVAGSFAVQAVLRQRHQPESDVLNCARQSVPRATWRCEPSVADQSLTWQQHSERLEDDIAHTPECKPALHYRSQVEYLARWVALADDASYATITFAGTTRRFSDSPQPQLTMRCKKAAWMTVQCAANMSFICSNTGILPLTSSPWLPIPGFKLGATFIRHVKLFQECQFLEPCIRKKSVGIRRILNQGSDLRIP